MRRSTDPSLFASPVDGDAEDEWPTRADVFSTTQSMDESGWKPYGLADDGDYAEVGDDYDLYPAAGEAGAGEEGDGELWGDTEGWEETSWQADEFEESPTDHDCTRCGPALALLEPRDVAVPGESERPMKVQLWGANEVSNEDRAADWQAVGIAQVGGAVGIAGGIACFDFRSKSADFRGTYLFVGGGIGLGGSLGGGVAPSPGDFIHNTPPDVWSALDVQRPFSGKDLDFAYASISSLGVGAAYGYTLMSITAGWADPLFTAQNVSGWGTGVGIAGAMLIGVWKLIGENTYY